VRNDDIALFPSAKEALFTGEAVLTRQLVDGALPYQPGMRSLP
jgi:hypothetical protein